MPKMTPHHAPLVSIVMTTYGHEKYILEAIKGVLIQKYNGPIEFILSNDASPDHTNELVDHFFDNYPVPENIKVKYTNHSQNKGSVPNLIWTLSQTCGKYIAFCEGDDFWIDPLKIQKQVDFLELHPAYGIVLTNVNFLHQSQGNIEEGVMNKGKFKLHLNFEDFLWERAYMATCTWLGKRDLFVDVLNEKPDVLDATFLIFPNALKLSQAHYISDITSVYRLLDESVSHSSSLLKLIERELSLYDTELFLINKFINEEKKQAFLQRYYQRHLSLLAYILKGKSKSIEYNEAIAMLMEESPSLVLDTLNKLVEIWESDYHRIIQKPIVKQLRNLQHFFKKH